MKTEKVKKTYKGLQFEVIKSPSNMNYNKTYNTIIKTKENDDTEKKYSAK